MMPVCVKWMIWVKSQKFYTHAFYVFKLKDLLQKTKTAYAHLKKWCLLHLRSLVTMFVPVQLKFYKLLPDQQPD